MPLGQRFLALVLPRAAFAWIKAGTKKWLLECPCGHKRDLWDAGGVKGEGTEQWTYKRCPGCGRWRWHKKRKKTESERTALD